MAGDVSATKVILKQKNDWFERKSAALIKKTVQKNIFFQVFFPFASKIPDDLFQDNILTDFRKFHFSSNLDFLPILTFFCFKKVSKFFRSESFVVTRTVKKIGRLWEVAKSYFGV